ncbi:MAG: shikimate dehydrogenase [Xanthomonadales bacterium]
MIRLAVFGSPISRSRSPEIHRLFARQCGLEIDFRAIEARPGTFPDLLEEFAAGGAKGCNVTVPLKHQAWKLAQKSSAGANRAQAANTLLFEDWNEWLADNTDGRGLIRDLVTHLDHPFAGSRVCIIGAGGAVAGILGDLLAQGPASIVIANRTLQRAQQLCESFTGVAAIPLQALEMQDPFNLIINATSLGHAGKHPGLPRSIFHPDSLCYDLNYAAAAEPLRNFCQEAKIRYQDGLGMLVEQAALSFELWTGKAPDTKPVLKQL